MKISTKSELEKLLAESDRGLENKFSNVERIRMIASPVIRSVSKAIENLEGVQGVSIDESWEDAYTYTSIDFSARASRHQIRFSIYQNAVTVTDEIDLDPALLNSIMIILENFGFTVVREFVLGAEPYSKRERMNNDPFHRLFSRESVFSGFRGQVT